VSGLVNSFRLAPVLTLLVACAGPSSERGVAPSSPEPVASAADPAGRITGYQFARRYDDVVKIDGRDVRQTVEYGFDYDRRATVRRILDLDGRMMSEDLLPESLRANPAEEARMNELVRTHPQLGPMMDEPGLWVHSGGFVVRDPEDPYCHIGSRCLRYIVSKGVDGSIRHIHAVVDLVSDRVVHPFYDDQTPAKTRTQGDSK
jgi:hypothetical protein